MGLLAIRMILILVVEGFALVSLRTFGAAGCFFFLDWLFEIVSVFGSELWLGELNLRLSDLYYYDMFKKRDDLL